MLKTDNLVLYKSISSYGKWWLYFTKLEFLVIPKDTRQLIILKWNHLSLDISSYAMFYLLFIVNPAKSKASEHLVSFPT